MTGRDSPRQKRTNGGLLMGLAVALELLVLWFTIRNLELFASVGHRGSMVFALLWGAAMSSYPVVLFVLGARAVFGKNRGEGSKAAADSDDSNRQDPPGG